MNDSHHPARLPQPDAQERIRNCTTCHAQTHGSHNHNFFFRRTGSGAICGGAFARQDYRAHMPYTSLRVYICGRRR